ncbi:hypothetical protein JTB14_013437 [Gonioctena quinquepunctata]|nr:hypothetical protein JTB14_013437 [Gonioctena quinquepunctata]
MWYRRRIPSGVSGKNTPDSSVQLFMKDINAQLQYMRTKQDELIESVTFCSNKVSNFEEFLKDMKTTLKIVEEVKRENEYLKKKVPTLNERMYDLEQHSEIKISKFKEYQRSEGGKPYGYCQSDRQISGNQNEQKLKICPSYTTLKGQCYNQKYNYWAFF